MKNKIPIKTAIILILISVFHPTVFADDGPYFIGKDSKAVLEQAKQSAPDNYVVAYHLGGIYLNEGNRDAAITEWSRYAATAPKDGKSAAVKERLTVLKIQRARENAQKAVNRSPGELKRAITENSVAVLNFNNLGATKYNVVAKGLTSMILTDLAKVETLTVVERERMQALMEETRLKQAGIVQKDESPKIGQMLEAKNVVWGEYTDLEKSDIRFSSTVTETEATRDLGFPNSQGPLANLFDMEKELVFEILEALGIKKEDLDPELRNAVEKYHTLNFDAFYAYSQGLDFQDQGRFAEANEAFRNAVRLDPGFDLANEAIISNPDDLIISEFWDIRDLEREDDFLDNNVGVEPDLGIYALSIAESAQNNTIVSNDFNIPDKPKEMPDAPEKPSE